MPNTNFSPDAHTVTSGCQPLDGALSSNELQQIVRGLKQARADWRTRQQRREFGGREFPSRQTLQEIVQALSGALFPMRLGPVDLRQDSEDFYVGHTLDSALNALLQQTRLALCYRARQQNIALTAEQLEQQSREIIRAFAHSLPEMRNILDRDVEAAFAGDPAASSVDEILLCYPGIQAVISYRLAHQLYVLGVPLLARMISELAHSATGIDIHSGASIGAGFFIDHGTGVVIGETAIIGHNVRIYQAVTLGAKRFEVDNDGNLAKDYPRHPIVEDNVVIYAGATILGRITIGQGSVIGGNVWLTHDVPPHSQVLQASNQGRTTTGIST